jgi:hypothetical protein
MSNMVRAVSRVRKQKEMGTWHKEPTEGTGPVAGPIGRTDLEVEIAAPHGDRNGVCSVTRLELR